MMADRRGLSPATVITGTSFGGYRTISSAKNMHQQKSAQNDNRSKSAQIEKLSPHDQGISTFITADEEVGTDYYKGDTRPQSAGMSSLASQESVHDGTVLSEGAKELCKMYEEKIHTGLWADNGDIDDDEIKGVPKGLIFANCAVDDQNVYDIGSAKSLSPQNTRKIQNKSDQNTNIFQNKSSQNKNILQNKSAQNKSILQNKSAQNKSAQNKRGTSARVTIVDARPYKIKPNAVKMRQKELDLLSYNTFQERKRARYAWLPQICERLQTEKEHPLRMFTKHKVHVLAELFRTSKKGDLGAHMVSSKAGDFQEEHDRELQRAVDEAEERATRELRAAMKRLRDDKEDEKNKALRNQKEYYEKLARRIEEQRNRAEEERERELTKKFMKQQQEALDKQWEECEVLKQEAIDEACRALTRKLRIEFDDEKEQAIAEALRIAKEKYLIRERNVIEKTRRECEEAARQEAARVAKLHQQEIDRCNQRYDLLEKKWQREMEHRKNVEQDFRELQDDYRRFMDYTDGMFHSDYLMQLRHMGQKLAEKQLKAVTYDDLERQYDFT